MVLKGEDSLTRYKFDIFNNYSQTKLSKFKKKKIIW